MQLEYVGIIILRCPRCSCQFVINSETVSTGFNVECSCGFRKMVESGSKATLTLQENKVIGTCQQPEVRVPDKMAKPHFGRNVTHYGYADQYDQNEAERERAKEHNAYVRQMNKEYDREDAQAAKAIKTLANAMPMQEYKAQLSSFVIEGKKPRVNKRNSAAISWPNDAEVRSIVEGLCSMGFKLADAKQKVNIALNSGIFMHDEIVKAVLAM